MKMTYQQVDCLSCGKEVFLEDDDVFDGEVDCPFCGYTIVFSDKRARIYEVEF